MSTIPYLSPKLKTTGFRKPRTIATLTLWSAWWATRAIWRTASTSTTCRTSVGRQVYTATMSQPRQGTQWTKCSVTCARNWSISLKWGPLLPRKNRLLSCSRRTSKLARGNAAELIYIPCTYARSLGVRILYFTLSEYVEKNIFLSQSEAMGMSGMGRLVAKGREEAVRKDRRGNP